MTAHETDELAHADFERSLLESARGDAPPAGATERAWRRFAADAALLVPLAAASAPRSWFESATARAARWTLIGALGGGGLVAVWLRPPAVREPPVAPAHAALPAPVADVPARVQAEPRVPTEPPASPAPAPGTLRGARPRKPAAPSLPPASGSPNAESSLAREVAALDAARTALAVGANASALRQIEQYHRDFPRGELSADADVVAIEALAARGDAAAAKGAARRFLQRHPRDPHVARIRELTR
jgi:hypothetical protein